jgi:hypothetical protein
MLKIIVAMLATTALFAQGGGKQANSLSPHDTATATIGGAHITISYGRPSLRGRKAVGGELVPDDKVWRMGADEATKLTTDKALDIGGVTVPPGSYSLFILPMGSGMKLIVNKTADQWGAFNYDAAQDLGRASMNVAKVSTPVEKFTITLESAGARNGMLKWMWENTVADVPVIAK